MSRDADEYLGDVPEWQSKDVRRGAVVIVELDPTEGSEQRGTRLYLVVQNDSGNVNAPTTIVVPFTTSREDNLCPFDVLLSATESPLREDPIALCSQIRTISIDHRINYDIGSIPDTRMEEVDASHQYSLGLTEL